MRDVCVLAALSMVLAAAGASAQPAPAFPITLQQAVRRAVEQYPAIRAASERVLAQESGVDLARTAYWPRLDSSLQLNRATRNNVAGLLLPGTNIPPISGPVSAGTSLSGLWGSGAGVLLSWEAFDFGQRGASVDLARTLVTRARATAALTSLDVGVSTADAFLRLAAAQEMVRAARANLQRQQVFADSVATLVRNALRPGADDSRAQAEMALARIQVAQAEQAEQVARAELVQWLGAPMADVRIEEAPLLAAPPAASPTPAAAHPLAETQLAAIEVSRAVQDTLSRSYVPRINVQTAYSLRDSGASPSGESLGGASGLGFDTPNWALGVTATFPVLDWLSLRERKRIEAHNEQAERAGCDRVVRELASQSDQARAQVEGARRVAESTPAQLAAARVLERQSRARYDAGLATIVEVADAQRLLLQAEVSDAVARLAIWRATLAEASARGDLSALLP